MTDEMDAYRRGYNDGRRDAEEEHTRWVEDLLAVAEHARQRSLAKSGRPPFPSQEEKTR